MRTGVSSGSWGGMGTAAEAETDQRRSVALTPMLLSGYWKYTPTAEVRDNVGNVRQFDVTRLLQIRNQYRHYIGQ